MQLKWVIAILIVVVVGGLIGWNTMRPDARLEVLQPAVETIRAYVEEQATTELPQDYLVAMPIAGWLEPITLREGDPVEAEQVVARLDTADLKDRVVQAQQRIAVLETSIRKEADHRLEQNALIETQATVKAIDETVLAAEKKLEASQAVADFARSEVTRLKELLQVDAAAGRELREAETTARKAEAEHQSDALELAALKTIAAVSYIGPKFITDYIDRKRFTSESYQKQLEEARADLEIEQRNLQRAELKSPVSGVILHRHQQHRQFLPAGTPLLTIGRLNDMEVIAEVLTQRATQIQEGDRVEIFGEGIPGNSIPGSVFRVYPAGFKKISSLGVEQQRVNVAVALDQRPPRLGVGFRVNVRIFHDEAENALTLPRETLFRHRDGTWQVMVVEQGRTRLQRVEVGLMNDRRAQILDGLSRTDHVVARPSREIVPGMRVETEMTP